MGLKIKYFLKKVKTALLNPKNHKVLLKDPVGPNEGPWLVMDPVGGSSCISRVPWYGFWCLECKHMANVADFLLWVICPPCLFKDSETPAWLGYPDFKRKDGHTCNFTSIIIIIWFIYEIGKIHCSTIQCTQECGQNRMHSYISIV